MAAEGFDEGVILLPPAQQWCWRLHSFQGDNISNIHNFLQDDPFIIHNIADAEVMSIEPALCALGFPKMGGERSFHLTITHCKAS